MKPAIFLLLGAAAALAQTPAAKDDNKLAPYYPTPNLIVERMLNFAGLKPGETMFDLGSGDGRIVIIAAQKFKAKAIGVELDNDLALSSAARVRRMGLEKTASIIHGDILTQDYSAADVITVYLLPASNIRVRPVLEPQLKKGTRIVAHDFEIGGWTPVKTETIADDGEGRSHTLFLYVR